MNYIPTPRPFRLSFSYAIIVLVIFLATLILFFDFSWYQRTAVAVSAMVAFGAFVIVEGRRLKEFGYDEKGVYRRSRLLFSWRSVRKMSLDFSESAHSVTLVARPSWAALLSGPVVNREAWVDYGISMVFNLDDGTSVAIPSNLDKMTDRGMIEDIHEAAKAANPSVIIE